jgi:hypothetical protein
MTFDYHSNVGLRRSSFVLHPAPKVYPEDYEALDSITCRYRIQRLLLGCGRGCNP